MKEEIRQVLRLRDILWIQKLVRQIPVTPHVVEYAVDLARATRPNESGSPDFVKQWLAWGAGPRAAQYLILGAKARAMLHGRSTVHASDVRAMAKPVLRHRLFTNFNADAEGVGTDQVIEKLVQTIPEPSYGEQGIRPSVSLPEPLSAPSTPADPIADRLPTPTTPIAVRTPQPPLNPDPFSPPIVHPTPQHRPRG
jgi:MoxR-like ATPase